MQQEAVYDLLRAPPHVPDDVRHTAIEFSHYKDGYSWALVMALRVMDAAARRFQLVVKTKRLATRARNKVKG